LNPSLDRQLDEILNKSTLDNESSWDSALVVAARTLTNAAYHEITTTTVVGVLGRHDADELRSRVQAIADEYGLGATVIIRIGSFSVRFERGRPDPE
jgi:hypothetical protein